MPLQDFLEGQAKVHKMAPDILEAQKQMEEIDLYSKPRLHVQFDPLKWEANNPMHHPSVYQLNQE